jgi:glycosyltransferase involved in cell wall biosynthesis
MMSQPLVSLCMPCHNAGRYLRMTLKSIEAQRYRPLEIIAVVDNSTDDTVAILEEAAREMPLKWLTAAFGSAAKSRNLAFANSRGEFIKYVDADDVLSPDLIERQVGRLMESADAVATSRYSRFVETPGERAFSPDPTWEDRESLDWILTSLRGGGYDSMLQSGMFLLPRRLIEEHGGWDERLSLIDDTEFFSRTILASERVLFTEGALYYRSNMPTSLSARRSRKAYESMTLSIELAVEHILNREDSPRTRSVCADFCQSAFYDIQLDEPDLASRLRRRAQELGGSTLRPMGGRVFEALSRVVGWQAASRLRRLARKWGYGKVPGSAGRTPEGGIPLRLA